MDVACRRREAIFVLAEPFLVFVFSNLLPYACGSKMVYFSDQSCDFKTWSGEIPLEEFSVDRHHLGTTFRCDKAVCSV